MSLYPTIRLLRMIGTPFEPGRVWEEAEESEELFQYAFKNRIGLLYLLALKEKGKLNALSRKYDELNFRAKETLVTAVRASEVLNDTGVDYIIFKTIRPYPATPNDVDIICLEEDSGYEKALNAFKKAEYIEILPAPLQFTFCDPRLTNKASITKEGGIYYLDLYKEAGADYFVYLDKSKLRSHRMNISLYGRTVKILCPEVELAVILMHSVFPEMSYGLESFYTTCYDFAQFTTEQVERFLHFVRRSYIVFPVRASLSLTAFLHRKAFGYVPEQIKNVLERTGGTYQAEIKVLRQNNFKTPHKFTFKAFLITFISKLRETTALKSIIVQLIHMLSFSFALDVFKSLHKKRTRETYIQV